jgi:hypothetical protein
LKSNFDITYYGVYEGEAKVTVENIKIIHIKLSGNKGKRKLLFIYRLRKFLANENFDYVFVHYFLGCSLLKLFGKSEINIDVRTGVINKSRARTAFFNFILRLEVNCFSKISCISLSLQQHLKLPIRTHILPLGAPELKLARKSFANLKLLYVGTFKDREIEKTIYGFARFLSKHSINSSAIYTIIGYGSDLEISIIKEAISALGMDKNIFLKGRINYPELLDHLQENNVGISFVPMRDCFDNQPPTKTFEYLLSGMAVVATGTKENCKVINKDNGIIIKDSVDDFINGLDYIYENREEFDSIKIQENSRKFSWDYIVKSNLYEYISE